MRRQDEVLALLPRADPRFRLVLLDLAGDLKPVHDSRDVESVLRASISSTDPWTRTAGLLSLSRFSESWAPARFRIAEPGAGPWTVRHLRKDRNLGVEAANEATRVRSSALNRRLQLALEPVTTVLVRALPAASADLRAQLLACISQLPTACTVESLNALLETEGSPEAAWALAACGTPAAHECFAGYLEKRATLDRPQVLCALQFLVSSRENAIATRAGALLERSIAAKRQNQIAAAAMALAGSPDAVERLSGTLATTANRWTLCHLLISLARAGAGLDTATRLYADSEHALHRTLAVRAAGCIAGDPAGEFLVGVVTKGECDAQAMALELLAQRGAPAIPPALLETLVGSAHWRVRLNAALLMAAQDPDRAYPVLYPLLTSDKDHERASGAFALAYLENADQILIYLLEDPSPLVRSEAVSSLARHRGGRPVQALARVALSSDAKLSLQALRALAWMGDEGISEAMTDLSRAARDRPHGEWRAEFYRTLGSLAAGGMPELVPMIVQGLGASEPEELVGCLDGLLIAGTPLDSVGEPEPATAAAPRVLAKMALGSVMQGHLESIALLRGILACDKPGSPDVLCDLREFLMLAPWLGRCARLEPLAKALMSSPGDSDAREDSSLPVDCRWQQSPDREPVEADPVLPAVGRNVPRLPPRALAIVGLPRPRATAPTGLRSGYYTPLPSPERERVLVAALVVALPALVMCGVMFGGVRSGSRPAVGPTGTLKPEANDRLLVCPLKISTAHSAALPRSLGPGDTLDVQPGDSATLVGPYPGPRINLAPGRVQLLACTARASNRPGSDVRVSLETGVYRVDLRPGASSIDVSVLGQKLTASGALFSMDVAPEERRIEVSSGSVLLEAPVHRTVMSGETFRWRPMVREHTREPMR